MGEHLLQQTLAPDMVVMAEYYAQGLGPPSPATAAAARYADEVRDGRHLAGVRLDDLVEQEVGRLSDSARAARGDPVPREELVIRALGAFVAASLMDRDEGLACLRRLDAGSEDALPGRLDEAVATAATGRDYSSTTAVPRRDMDPRLADVLGIDTARSLTPAEVANLVNGQRADGNRIEGKQRQPATEAIGVVFGFDIKRMPTATELECALDGCRADGCRLAPDVATAALRRFQAVLGAGSTMLSPEQRQHILAGRTASGAPLATDQFHARMDTSRTPIGYVDLTFSAPKSVSVAWAFAPTQAERGIIHQAHCDAIDSVMIEIERHIGRARKGRGGHSGSEPGAIGWVSFDHYTSRPTVAVVRQDAAGHDYTELYTVKGAAARVAGDMQLHTHTAVFNAVLAESGRIGGLDLAQLDGRIKEWGSLYQAFLATNLRRHGVDVVLDARTEMARVTAVPERVTEHFSKRTVGGTEAARAYAASQGLDWDTLDPERKIGLLKQSVQDPRGAKSDDLGDAQAWRRAAAEIRYHHRSILRPDEPLSKQTRFDRLELAYQAALPVFDRELQRRASVEGADARLAAAKGLIAAGIGSVSEVNEVTRAFRERGVMQNGELTSLIWGAVSAEKGRARVGVTTALHESEERALVAAARAASQDRSAALTPETVVAAVARFPDLDFSGEHGCAQRAMLERLATGGRFGVAIGVAGSGKTTLLRPLVDAWKVEGRTVHGIALAWRQSDDLREAGIPAQNTRAVEAFLRGLERNRIRLDERSVVVVDELGLLGTRQLNQLLRAQRTLGFQVIALGDPRQMQSIEAGSVIELLRRALGDEAVPKLETSVRQVEAVERETVLMFRNGQTAEAVQRKAGNGTLRIVPGGYEEAVAGVVQLWQARRAENRGGPDYSITISTPTNHDAHQISLAIRAQRRALGEVGVDRRTIQATDGERNSAHRYELPLAEGDRVRLFKRTGALFLDTGKGGNIGQNGSVLTIAGVRDDGLILQTRKGRQGLVVWEALRHEQNGRIMLAYGDVLTTHTTQGATVSEHIFALPGGSRQVNAFAAYTSGSRHRETSYIVTSDGAERAEIAGRRPLGDKRLVHQSDVLANITRNFARQPVKETALALLERAENVRRGTVRRMQTSKQVLEQRAVDGKPRPHLARAFRRSGDEALARGAISRLVDSFTAGRALVNRVQDFGAELRKAVRYAMQRAVTVPERVDAKSHLQKRRGLRV